MSSPTMSGLATYECSEWDTPKLVVQPARPLFGDFGLSEDDCTMQGDMISYKANEWVPGGIEVIVTTRNAAAVKRSKGPKAKALKAPATSSGHKDGASSGTPPRAASPALSYSTDTTLVGTGSDASVSLESHTAVIKHKRGSKGSKKRSGRKVRERNVPHIYNVRISAAEMLEMQDIVEVSPAPADAASDQSVVEQTTAPTSTDDLEFAEQNKGQDSFIMEEEVLARVEELDIIHERNNELCESLHTTQTLLNEAQDKVDGLEQDKQGLEKEKAKLARENRSLRKLHEMSNANLAAAEHRNNALSDELAKAQEEIRRLKEQAKTDQERSEQTISNYTAHIVNTAQAHADAMSTKENEFGTERQCYLNEISKLSYTLTQYQQTEQQMLDGNWCIERKTGPDGKPEGLPILRALNEGDWEYHRLDKERKEAARKAKDEVELPFAGMVWEMEE